jgi:glycosyltransferase involved in cell wall biosynthesis
LKILVLSFYYKPDLCAGSFRTSALIDELKNKNDVEIELLTTMPNRYSSFSTSAVSDESDGNVRVKRIELPSHKSGMLDQIKSFSSYYLEVQKLVKHNDYDLVFATSSRLFTAFLGSRIAKKKKIPLYLDIRDIFVDTIKDVLPSKLAFFVKPLMSIVEKYTFSSAKHINLVSKGFEEYFKSRYPKPTYTFYTNGIDAEFLGGSSENRCVDSLSDITTVLYAGNIGEGQGLHNIIPQLAKVTGDKVKFNIIGDGGRKEQLKQAIANIPNVELLPPVNRKELIQKYLEADVLFLHLNDYPAFEKVLPSKVFEYASVGKPILAGVSGYSAEFIQSEIPNSQVFYPSDHAGALDAFNRLELGYTDRGAFVEKYNRSKIMEEMCDSILKLGVDNKGH